jgi:hypothetical protein
VESFRPSCVGQLTRTMMPAVQVKVYDPRLGQDYSVSNFTTKRTFSSSKHGLYVWDCVGPLDWSSELPLITESIQRTARRLFFMLDPWQPQGQPLYEALTREFGPLLEFERSVCGYTRIGLEVVEQLFELRRTFGGDTTGQWCIGGCLQEFTAPVRTGFTKAQLWDLALVLDQADKLGCVLWLGEMQQSLFATRPFEELNALLQRSPAARFAQGSIPELL